MALPRADRLKEPPVVGRWYMVPVVWFDGWQLHSGWPVMGKRHADAEHLNYPHKHFHVDVRFVTAAQIRAMTWGERDDLFVIAARVPLVNTDNPPPSDTRLERRRCRYSDHAYPIKRTLKSAPFNKLYSAYAGRECKSGKSGWICPHRNFALGSIAPVDGVITCPLHGLRIDAETGAVLRVGPGPSGVRK